MASSYLLHIFKSALLILIFSLLAFEKKILSAQDITFQLAGKFFANGNDEAAITEYKRFIFFNPDHDSVGAAYYQIGIAHRNQEEWSAAIDAIQTSISLTIDARLKEKRKIDIAIINIARGEYSTAEFDLLRIAYFSDNIEIKRKAYFFLGLCYIYRFKWEEARQAFDQFFTNSLTTEQAKIDSLFTTASELNLKSPRLAKWLSTFIPGSGQLYVGDIRNGINALVLNSIIIYFFVDALLEQRLQDALIGDLFLLERYYRGNRANAERIAREFNEEINRKFAQTIIENLRKLKTLQ